MNTLIKILFLAAIAATHALQVFDYLISMFYLLEFNCTNNTRIDI